MRKKRPVAPQRPKGWLASHAQIEAWQDQAGQMLVQKNYSHAVDICKKALRYLPQNAPKRAELYHLMGNAYGLLQQFEESYQVLSKALAIAPNDPYIWYNRAVTCRYTARTAQSLRDLERAIELEGAGDMTGKFAEELAFAQQLVQSELATRGPHFTIEELLEQQEWFQQGLRLSAEHRWEEAAEAYRHSIAMGDCLPQPQGNLGMCLLMLQRFDEAEQALRRALEIDPQYKFARRNLEILEQVRETGAMPVFGGIQSPFEGHELKKSLTIRYEKETKR